MLLYLEAGDGDGARLAGAIDALGDREKDLLKPCIHTTLISCREKNNSRKTSSKDESNVTSTNDQKEEQWKCLTCAAQCMFILVSRVVGRGSVSGAGDFSLEYK